MRYLLLNLLLIWSMLLGISCRGDGEANEEISLNSHIQFFGFTLVDTLWDDPTDTEHNANYKDEVYPFSNIADILVVDPEDYIAHRINAFSDLEMKAILHLNELFFEIRGTDSPSGTAYGLRIDYQERWNRFVATNTLKEQRALIGAFYIGEEPTWNGISFEELEAVSHYVKMQFPDVPIMLIEAAPMLTTLQVPTSVDWLGFDHYFVQNPLEDNIYQQEWALLKSKRSASHQRIVVVMDTHYISEAHGEFGGIALDEMNEVAQSYYALAQSEVSVIMVLSYFWPNGFDAPNSIGARGMPSDVLEEYMRIGKEISGKE
ncbi:hypothetical protein [Spongiimicrobium salis]|uniref:hypothetical protein n=1 Tax=Spongiimicrobium salis TaxID=1667022 RepID=UPI00374D94E5